MVWSGENLCPIGVVTWLGSADTSTHQRLWLSEVGAAVHTGDGGRLDGPRVVAQRSAVLPGAAVAPAADGLKKQHRWMMVKVSG
jgi:hypothetical protein